MIGFVELYNGATTTYYFNRNLQGDVTEIYDNTGALKVTYRYDAWGNCTVSGSDTSLGGRNKIRYRGYYFDTETEFYHLGARYYCPEWRRFISPDDTAYIDPQTPNGLNLYCYCNNDPVDYTDSNGRSAVPVRIAYSELGCGEPSTTASQDSQVHWKFAWFDTDWPSFFYYSTGKITLIDWALSVFSGNLYFTEQENMSLFFSLGNISLFAGSNLEKQQVGIFGDANLLSFGYDGLIIDLSISLVGVGFKFGIEDSKLVVKFDPPGWFGFEIGVDYLGVFQ